MLDIIICNFNTTDLTNNLIESIFKNLKKDFFITILDNSDSIPFKIYNQHDNIKILDNTKSKILNFDDVILKFKNTLVKTPNNYGSVKHCMSVDFLIKKSEHNDILLFDSDTILLKDIDFIDSNYITISDISKKKEYNLLYKKRFLPFLQYFNKKRLLENKINYFDPNRIVGLNYRVPYDTGASFTEDIFNQKINFKLIDHTKYIKHYGHRSWKL